jgi:hypothetical protein
MCLLLQMMPQWVVFLTQGGRKEDQTYIIAEFFSRVASRKEESVWPPCMHTKRHRSRTLLN